MTETELKEYNDFVGQNIIRNNFLPILYKFSTLPNSNLKMEERANVDTKETTSIKFSFLPKIIPPKKEDYDDEYDNPIIWGNVCYDWTVKDDKPVTIYDRVIFNFWWGGENYTLLYSVEEALIAIDGFYNGEPRWYAKIKALRKAKWEKTTEEQLGKYNQQT
jgi:hypothetical protein